MGGIVNCCCIPSPDCEGNCVGTAPPTGVALTVPGQGAVNWIYPAYLDPFSCDYIIDRCYNDATWVVYEEGTCTTPWPPFNSNNTRYAVGTSQPCIICSGASPPPDSYTLWFEEYQGASRVKSWYRKYWRYKLLIQPYTMDGTIQIQLRIGYGACFASAQTIGLRNRMKQISVDCPAGVVSALSDWQYAPALNLIEPQRCVNVDVAGCFSEVSADVAQSCTDYSALAGNHRTNGVQACGSEFCCLDSPVYFHRTETAAACNGGASISCEWDADFDFAQPFGREIYGSNHSQCGAGERVWSKYINCNDLYLAPITLNLIGPSVGGSSTVQLTRANPTISDPSKNGLGGILQPCEFDHTPGSITSVIPDTITLTFS